MMVSQWQIQPRAQAIIFRRDPGDTVNVDFDRFDWQRVDGNYRELHWTVDYGESRQADWQPTG